MSEDLPRAPTGSPQLLRPLTLPVLRVIQVGSAVWALALVVTLLVPSLHEGARAWWPATCVAGLVLGGIGWLVLRRGTRDADPTPPLS